MAAAAVVGGLTACGPGEVAAAPPTTGDPTSVRTAHGPSTPDPTGAGDATDLTGHYFVGQHLFNTMGSDGNFYGVAFLSDGWAYWGRPKAGLPSCTDVTGQPSAKKPTTGWGCVHYSYDADSGKVNIGGLDGSYRGGALTVNDWTFSSTKIPASGSRLEVDLINRGYSGQCGGYVGCTTWSTSLVLTRDGHFVKSGQAITSRSGFGWAASIPPDEKGTYEVLDGARVTLSYESGKTETMTLAELTDDSGRADPADHSGDAGLVLGTDHFYTEDD